MKTYAVALAIALAAVLMFSNTAQAHRRIYLRPAPVRVHVLSHVTVRTVHPLVVPYTTTLVSPTVTPTIVIGPRGRLHYVAPLRPIVTTPAIVW